jgi:DNA-binding NarL/FixJ family response regulator
MMEKLRRILIVDGDALLKAGLQALLAEEPDIDVLAEAWLQESRARTLPNSSVQA